MNDFERRLRRVEKRAVLIGWLLTISFVGLIVIVILKV